MKSKIPKRLLSSLLSVALLSSTCTIPMAFADDLDTNTVDTSSSTQSTEAVLTAEALMFNITVPTSIPIDVSSTGKVSVGDDFTM